MNVSAMYLLTAIVLVSLNPVWIQLALWGGSSPLALIFWQAFCAMLLFGVYALLKDKRLFFLSKKQILRLLLLGSLGFFLMALCFTLSLERLNASYTVMLFFSYPFFVLAVNALIYRTKLTWLEGLSLFVLFCGVLVITWPQGRPGGLTGIILALGAAMAHAFFILYSGRNLKQISSLQVAMFAQFGFFLAAVFLLPFLDANTFFVPAGIIYGSILAVLSSFFGFILFLKGISGLGANRAALISVTNLPLSLLFSFLILRDQPTGHLMIGFLIILLGLLLDASSAIYRANRQPSRY
ncbi:MAG: DMT family transporter [Bacillota bacterium]|nr:DMT family transporter [Bacillota bacterium]MDW7683523.1 DMT family transporter [Bacillota bacterium]